MVRKIGEIDILFAATNWLRNIRTTGKVSGYGIERLIKWITVCLAVFIVFILVPIYIISLITTAINMGFAKLILNIGFIGFAFVVIFAFGVILSLIYTTYSRIHNKCRYPDEDLYKDIDYEDTDE